MTRYFISPVLFAVLTIACSSSTTTNVTAEETGGNTSIETTAGNSSTGGSGNIGTTGQVTTGGNTVTSTTNTTSVAGSPSTGGNGIGTTGGSSPASTCVPKTCDQIAPAWTASSTLTKPTACGMASDGCGNLMNCGACVTDGTVNTDCGQEPTTYQGVDLKSRGLVATANVCGTRCFKAPDIGGCKNNTPIIFCPSTIPPVGLTGCTSVNASINSWCCDAS